MLILLRRGLLAGGIAGLVGGMFSYLLAEPVMDRAVRLEAAREEATGGAEHAEVFARSTQHIGLLVATTVTGLALGVLFAVVYGLLHRHDPQADPWRRSIGLAAAAFTAVWLLPFLRYPANPPGVGDEDTASMRTAAWLAAIAIGLFAVAVAWRLHAYLTERGVAPPLRQLAVGGILVVALAALFLLPGNPDAIDVPAGLLWDFRLLSIASALVLWGGLGVGFGLLGERAAHRATAAREKVGSPS